MAIGDLTAFLEPDEQSTLRVRLTGKSASREASKVLAPLFDRTLGICRSEARGLELHFERLDYFNSSTIAALVQFIRSARDAAVPLTIVYDPAQRWQAMSFDALRRALRPFDDAQAGVHFTGPSGRARA